MRHSKRRVGALHPPSVVWLRRVAWPRAVAWPCMLMLVLFAAARASPAADAKRDLRDILGVTHVAGAYHLTDKDFLNEGADQVLALGSRVIKLYLARPAHDYPFNTPWPEAKSLVQMAETEPYRRVFAKPFTTYILTVYAVGRPDHYWTAGISPAQKADETRQFRDLARHFLTAYRGTGKTFVLQHWEGDWAIRGRTDPKADLKPEAVAGMAEWLAARQEGVRQARAEAGETGARVFHAAEVNLVVQAMRGGRPGVADKVLPQVALDLVSYSAWDAQDDPKTLRAALDFIASHARPGGPFGAKKVYIGEFGKPENEFGPERVLETVRGTVAAGLDWGCPYIVYWQVYCNEAKTRPVRTGADVRGFWLLRPDGTKSPVWGYFAGLFEKGR